MDDDFDGMLTPAFPATVGRRRRPYARAVVPAPEHLLEYQDHVLAYRLRALVGGRLRPRGPLLTLPEYAALRLRRQRLARDVVARRDYHAGLREIEDLTERLCFGFWHDPSETVAMLRGVAEVGGCGALDGTDGFLAALLTARERARAGADGARLAGYYLGLVRASAAYLDAETFTRLRDDVERERRRLPMVVDLAVPAVP